MSNETEREARIDRLCLDIDLRLREQWHIAFEVDDQALIDMEMVGALMRSAYVQGYTDALREAVEGQLHREHGYRVPERRQRGR